MKPVSAAKNRPVCAAAAKRSSQLRLPAPTAGPVPGTAQGAGEQLLEEGPTHQHSMGRDADLASPASSNMPGSRRPIRPLRRLSAIRSRIFRVNDGSGWSPAGVPVEIEDDDLPARPGHPDHLSERLFGRLQMHEGPLRAAAIERFVGQIQPLRVAQAVLQ